MKRTLTTWLLDLAERIAPPYRRGWIDGLRAEADFTAAPAAWAWGAVSTALRQRLRDTVVSGLALRLVLGGFVIAVAATIPALILIRFPTIRADALHKGLNLLPMLLAVGAVFLLMLSGGLAILFSAGRPWIDRYGRVLFSLNALWIGYSFTLMGYHSLSWPHAMHLQHQVATLAGIAGPLFIAAALALIFRRPRLFLVLASGALLMEIAQYGAELPHRHLHQITLWAIAFFNACQQGLLLLAAGGLLIGRKTPMAA